MRFATISAATLTFAVSAMAQVAGFDAVTSPPNNAQLKAGEPFTIKWQPGDVKGTIKIGLIGGATQNTQEPISTIQAGVNNQDGSFTWTVPETLGDKAVYGLTLTLESNPATFQYSFPFHITPKSGAVSSAASAPSAASNEGGYKASGMPTVTVSLSSAASTAAASSSAPAYKVSSVPAVSTSKAAVPTTSAAVPAYSTIAPPKNSSATYSAGVPTTLATTGAGNSTKPTGAPTPIPTAGASRVAAGSVFAVGAAAAFFFL